MITYDPHHFWSHIFAGRESRIERILSRVFPLTLWAFFIEFFALDAPFTGTT